MAAGGDCLQNRHAVKTASACHESPANMHSVSLVPSACTYFHHALHAFYCTLQSEPVLHAAQYRSLRISRRQQAPVMTFCAVLLCVAHQLIAMRVHVPLCAVHQLTFKGFTKTSGRRSSRSLLAVAWSNSSSSSIPCQATCSLAADAHISSLISTALKGAWAASCHDDSSSSSSARTAQQRA